MSRRVLIVNADDFGQTAGVNRGIVEAHERGIVTSASLMVRGDAIEEATRYARRRPELAVGLHVDLGEWVYRGGEWVALYEVVTPADASAVRDEVERQLGAFRDLVGRDPTHIDSHQHVHLEDPARAIVQEIAGSLEIPARRLTPDVSHCGSFYGQTAEGESLPGAVSADALAELIRGLEPGITELGCHPGDGSHIDGMYVVERAAEREALCDPRIRAMLDDEEIELRSFGELRSL